jgi:hypothetical protein
MRSESGFLNLERGTAAQPVDIARNWEAAMRRGDFEAAWRETDRMELTRRKLDGAGKFAWTPDYLLWNGESWAGKRVLIRCNHGLGDTLQFIRFVPQIFQSANSVTVFAQPALVRLLAMSASFGDVRDGWTSPVPPHDIEMEIMELAYAFRCTRRTLPGAVPYLPARVIAETSALSLPPVGAGVRVGILWKASVWDEARSLPISALKSIGEAKGVQFFSLQQGLAARLLPFPCFDLSPRTTNITDLAAAMLQLDLVISVDCMAAHLAGALGVPAWLLLKEPADWRWMDHALDSPWYPHTRLFRQESPGDWPSVSKVVGRALEDFASALKVPA